VLLQEVERQQVDPASVAILAIGQTWQVPQ
jgi:hypothetical protein